MTKVAIVGSRARNKATDKDKVLALVAKLKSDDLVISGGCVGVDTWAEEFAGMCGLGILIFYPDFAKYPLEKSKSKAYFMRNRKIAEACDIVYAFVKEGRGRSGVENTIKHAKELGKEIVIMEP